MKKNDKTVEKILNELEKSKKRIIELKKSHAEFRKTQEAQKENDQNFHDLVENLLDGVTIIDKNGYHLYVNPKFSEITGYSKDELLKMTGWDFTRPEDVAKLKKRMKVRMAGRSHQKHYDRIFIRKDGTEVFTEMSTTTTTWHGKNIPCVLSEALLSARRWKRRSNEERRILV